MKPQFQHQVTTSFVLWADNFITKKADAFSSKSSDFYADTGDARLGPGLVSYNSPYKQWVSDESIEGANIPSGVYDNGTFVPRGQDGLKIDFDNGRVIFDSSFGANKTTLSGDYTVKDFNFYITNQTEEQLIVESKFDSNSRFKQSLGGIEPYKQVIPAIFVNSEMAENEPFAFGGEDKTTTSIRCVVFAENTYQLDGALSVFADSKNEVFAKLGFEDFPLTEYGDTTGFNYKELATSKRETFFSYRRGESFKIKRQNKQKYRPISFCRLYRF